MPQYNLIFPDWYEDEVQLIEDRGWYRAKLEFREKTFDLEFYDPFRLSQDIACGVANLGYFIEAGKIVVVERVTRAEMEKAASKVISYL